MTLHSSGHPAQDKQLCQLCGVPQRFHSTSEGSHPAYWNGKAVVRLTESSQESEREILRVPLAEGGSFLIRRGGVDWRSWWLTVSFASGCLVLTLEPSESGSSDTTSASGTATGKTSDSSRLSNGEADIIGTAAHTHAEED